MMPVSSVYLKYLLLNESFTNQSFYSSIIASTVLISNKILIKNQALDSYYLLPPLLFGQVNSLRGLKIYDIESVLNQLRLLFKKNLFDHSVPRTAAHPPRSRPLRRSQGVAGPSWQAFRHRPSISLSLWPLPEGPGLPHHRPQHSHFHPSQEAPR